MTRILWIEIQLCPAFEKAWTAALSAASLQSPYQSQLTISGALEPSSRFTFFCGALARIAQPTARSTR